MPVSRRQGGHWYKRDGTPMYEVECKTKPGQMRPTTVRDARELGLIPSVTTITKISPKPFLEDWRVEQFLKAADENTRRKRGEYAGGRLVVPSEHFDDWTTRISRIAQEKMSEAPQLGTDFHKDVEVYLRDGARIQPSDMRNPLLDSMMDSFIVWTRGHIYRIIETEKCFASPLGFAGRTDLLCMGKANPGDQWTRVLADVKTQSTTQGRKVRAYPEYGMQLAAYAAGLGEPPTTKLWNIIVSTIEKGRVEVHDWTLERQHQYRQFEHLMNYWIGSTGYDPRWEGE